MIKLEEIVALEKLKIVDALRRTNGNGAEAARLLGLNVRTFWRRIESHKIIIDEFRPVKKPAAA